MADLVAPVRLSDGWFGPSVNRQMWQMEADAVLPFSAPSGSACELRVFYLGASFALPFHSSLQQLILATAKRNLKLSP